MNKITKITEKLPQPATIPDGIYQGIWGGYKIEVKIKDKTYEMTTEEGVRGINVPVIITIKDGEATFVTLNNQSYEKAT